MATLIGTPLNDRLLGTTGVDTLRGNAGNDTLQGNAGADTYLIGRGDGQDLIVFDTGATDTVQFDAGIGLADIDVRWDNADLVLVFRGSNDSVRLPNYFNAAKPPLIRFADGGVWDFNTVSRRIGVPENDTLFGTSAAETLDGGIGRDSISGGAGNDTLYGDRGNDTMDGGTGNDVFYFGRGDDQDTILNGNLASQDILRLGSDVSAADIAFSNDAGDLLISLQNNNDTLRIRGYFGAPLSDRIRIQFTDGAVLDGAAVNRLLAEQNDVLFAGSPTGSLLHGGFGDDVLTGGPGNDTLYGDSGNDTLDGGSGAGADTFLFGRGDGQDLVLNAGPQDRLKLGAGIGFTDVSLRNDNLDLVLSLRGGSDSVRITGYFNVPPPERPAVQFADGTVWNGLAIERKLVSTDDLLVGSPGSHDYLDGGLGNDMLRGLEGNDTLYGGAGDDQMDGGIGADTFLFGRGDGRDLIIDSENASNVASQNRLKFDTGINLADVDFRREGAALLISLRDSDDSVRITDYFLGTGPSRMSIQFADGVVLDGSSIDRKLTSGGFRLQGTSPSANLLDGGHGNDTLVGGTGSDTLYGDEGNDQMQGGAGSDTYLFGRGDGQDVILLGSEGSGLARDRVQFGNGIGLADLDLRRLGNDLVVALQGSPDSLRLQNYFTALAPQDRPVLEFLDGTALDGPAIERVLAPTNDQIVLNSPTGTLLHGGLGNDQLTGGSGNDTLYGDAGNDVLDGGPGSGADTYLFGIGDGQDVIFNSNSKTSASLDRLQLGWGIEMADVDLRADNSDLVLSLRGSPDSVRIAGYMLVEPTHRMSIVFADGGLWDGETVQRQLFAGDDVLIWPYPQGARLDAGAGNDLIIGGTGNDTLVGGTGNDTLDGGPGGSDTYEFMRGDGRDLIINNGSTGVQDRLRLGSGIAMTDVELRRNNQDLELVLRDSSDSIHIEGYFATPVMGRIGIQFADGAVWDASIIDRKIFSSNDQLSPPNFPSQGALLDGGLGNDTITGGSGSDTLYGDAGDDYLNGGNGDAPDTFFFGRGDGHDVIDYFGNYSFGDRLVLGAGIGAADIDVIGTGSGLLLKIRGTPDSVEIPNYFALDPFRRIQISFADGSAWDDATIERKLVSIDDSLSGTQGNDLLDGGLGNDMLFGNQGDDTLYGDAGNDMMDGGSGADTYLFGRGDGQDLVLDYDGNPAEQNRLKLASGIGLSDIEVRREFDVLVLTLAGSSDSVRIPNYFYAPTLSRMRIEFADGSVLDGAAIERRLVLSDDHLFGTPGDDLLDGGLGNDVLVGMEGNDTLYGGVGNDMMEGGTGSDTYLFGRGDGQDAIMVGADLSSDRIRFGAGIGLADIDLRRDNSDLVASLQGSSDSLRLLGYFISSPERPTLQFADGSVLDGQAIERAVMPTDDQLFANSPDDVLLDGGLGNDNLWGGSGNDTLYGDAGNDMMDGGSGADTYFFGRGDGQDLIFGGTNYPTDRLQLGSGIGPADIEFRNDLGALVLSLSGSSDSVRILGYFNGAPMGRMPIWFADGSVLDGAAVERKVLPSDDYLAGSPDNDFVDGGLGNDMLFGTLGDDTLYGDAGNDMMDGGPGADTYLFGRGDGQDLVLDYDGNPAEQNRLKLGSGINLADIEVRREFDVLVLSLSGSSDSVRIPNYFYVSTLSRMPIEFADGSVLDGAAIERKLVPSDDQFFGTPGDELLDGGLGNDMLVGMEGNDTLYGDAGNDLMDGGLGSDTYVFGRGDGQDVVLVYSDFSSRDRVRFGAGIGLADIDLLREGGDLVVSLQGSADTLRLQGYFSGSVAEIRPTLQFADGSVLDGQAIERAVMPRDDQLFANSPDGVLLDGGLGNDYLSGGSGNDTLYGDAGNDTMDGGPGADTYFFGRGDGQDQIFGGASFPTDRLQLGSGIGPADIELRNDLGALVISLSGSSDSVRIVGYFNGVPMDRMPIQFADGSVLDGAAVERKLSSMDDQLFGTPGNDFLDGGLGNDFLVGGDGNDTLYGDAGWDTMEGGSGSDTYFFGRGDGRDTVYSNGPSGPVGTVDTLRLGAGISVADVDLRRGADELIVSLRNSSDAITLTGYFSSYNASPLAIAFADGVTWDRAEVEQRLAAADTDEQIVGTTGNDSLDGRGGNDTLIGLAGDDTLLGGSGNDLLQGDEGADLLIGGTGNDSYVVDAADTVVEDANGGSDTVHSGANHVLAANVETLILTGTSAQNATGNGLDNLLIGNAIGNTLDGGAGADEMRGGAGDDTYIVDRIGDRVIEAADEGFDDWVKSSVSYVLGDNLEWLELTGPDAFNGIGNSLGNHLLGNYLDNLLDGGDGNDVLFGDGGNDTLRGGAGDDVLNDTWGGGQLIGGAGNDSYWVDPAATVVEEENGGSDTVNSWDSHVLAANVEALTLYGAEALNGTGNALANVITGNTGNNVLDGAGGADEMRGLAGDDTYIVSQAGDLAIENANEGTDTVKAGVSYVLGANVEHLTLTGSGSVNATGNALANRLQGNAGANVLDGGSENDYMAGGAGDDTYLVDSSGDIVFELSREGIDTVIAGPSSYTLGDNVENLVLDGMETASGFGNALDNRLTGNFGTNRLEGGAGNDTLDGGAGRDTMVGGEGNDTYIVDSSTDVVTEVAGQGIDTVQSSANYTLGTAQENLTLLGTANLSGSGNAGDNVLLGNSGNNTLNGLAGVDYLDGGAGADTMTGGSGADTYVVDNLGDLVVEVAGGGSDTVRASISYTLGTSQEDLTLIGTANINGTGNEQENILIGNDGNNVLDGGADDDLMQGGLGSDTYMVDHASDIVVESAGDVSSIDTVITSVNYTLAANVENIVAAGTGNRSLIGNDGANTLTGNAGDNTLDGAGGSDVLSGGAGKDTLHGGAGDDTLLGGTGSDTYRFEIGGGFDHIQEDDSASTPRDRVVFGAGILQGDVQFARVGQDLQARVFGGADGLSIDNWYDGSRYRVEEFAFADGTVITAAQAQALVGAMAAFSAPAAGSTSLTGTSSWMTTQDLAVTPFV